MSKAPRRVLQRLERLRRHAAIALALFAASAVVGLASVMDAAGRLIAPLSSALFGSAQQARTELAQLGLPYSVEAFVDRARTGHRVAVRWFLRAAWIRMQRSATARRP